MCEVIDPATLLTVASSCVYMGSYLSLHTPVTTRKLRKDAGLDPNADEDSDESQSLNSKSAWLFPVIGSAVLFSLYLAFKFLDREMLNLVLGAYFALTGCFALPTVLRQSGIFFLGLDKVKAWQKNGFQLDVSLVRTRRSQTSGESKEVENKKNAWVHVSEHISLLFLVILALVMVLLVGYMYTKHWVLANVVAICFAVQAILLITLDSFMTGFILLGGLFFYDIFWVFGSTKVVGTSVMVNVAKNFDGPIKILSPNNIIEVVGAIAERGFHELPKLKFSLLGLGDIVIPGVFVALALRFDQMHASNKQPSLDFTRYYYHFPKPYFTASLAAYVGGLLTTMGVMHFFKAAQPALLYLSPACALSVVFVALVRGELHELGTWVDKSTEPLQVEEGKSD